MFRIRKDKGGESIVLLGVPKRAYETGGDAICEIIKQRDYAFIVRSLRSPVGLDVRNTEKKIAYIIRYQRYEDVIRMLVQDVVTKL